ncbi:MAG: patatin-like phospholipase family protein, partial [Cupriavidus sp.]|nr:patatin-like phospholipase family protein [Cupriavidus sp.]
MAAKERQERAVRQAATPSPTAESAANGESLAERGAQVRPRKPVRKAAKAPDRPAHEAYAVRALVLQGGGA